MFAFPEIEQALTFARHFLEKSVPDLPPDAWWVPALGLLVLGGAAAIDTFTAIIPDVLIFPGVLAMSFIQGKYISWQHAGINLAIGIGAALGVCLLNALWFLFFKRDALGMGDAKWTMLAIVCFGWKPVLFAWGIGACLAVLWIGAAWLVSRRTGGYVHFAPFLFAGLLAALWYLRIYGGV